MANHLNHGYEKNWEALANAIILQAINDYRITDYPRTRTEIEQFFQSAWFATLTDLDPEYLIEELRKEKIKHGRKRISGTGKVS